MIRPIIVKEIANAGKGLTRMAGGTLVRGHSIENIEKLLKKQNLTHLNPGEVQKRGLIYLPSSGKDAIDKFVQDHEMTHWARNKKWNRLNIPREFIEESIANTRAMRKMPEMKDAKIFTSAVGTAAGGAQTVMSHPIIFGAPPLGYVGYKYMKKHEKKASIFDPVQKQLMPMLWNGYELRPGVSETILARLKEFYPANKISHVTLVGSSAQYQYTDDSDIDIQVNGVEGESVDSWKDVFRPHNQSLEVYPNSKHPLNFFFREYMSFDIPKLFEHSLGAYDLLNHTWLKKPIPPDVIKDPLVKYDALVQYSKIYSDSIGYMVHALAKTFEDMAKYPKESERYADLKDIVRSLIKDLTYKYEEINQAKKLTYRYRVGTPSLQENTIIYKYITHGPYGHLLKVLGRDES